MTRQWNNMRPVRVTVTGQLPEETYQRAMAHDTDDPQEADSVLEQITEITEMTILPITEEGR